jgi:hypothetical protein
MSSICAAFNYESDEKEKNLLKKEGTKSEKRVDAICGHIEGCVRQKWVTLFD